eukprot:scpid30109/ scgid1421/ Tubulin polyglutamylase TTLL5; SRC1 and TIF2-associated modulatory protein; Tubulin--tyrosine ligase-like protein 5
MTICVALYSTTFMWPGDGQVQRAVVMADQQPVLLFSTRLLLDKMQQDNGGSSDGDSALLPIAKVYSMKVVLDTDSALVSDIFRTHGFEEARNDDVKFNLIWTDRVLKPEILPDMRIYQKVNHFPRSTELCEDGNLFWNIQQMRSCKDKQLFDFMPDSYDLPSDRIELKKCIELPENRTAAWIVKPHATGSGETAYVTASPHQLSTADWCVVQRYIPPMLIDDRPCCIKVYVCVTSFDPLKIYLYGDGLVSFQTDDEESGKKRSLLTNYSLNLINKDFVHWHSGEGIQDFGEDTWTFGALLRYLCRSNVDVAGLVLQIEDVVIRALLCCQSPIAAATRSSEKHRGNCFELFEAQLLVDSCLKPWLLKVKGTPCFDSTCPIEKRIKSNLLADLLSLVGLQAFKPREQFDVFNPWQPEVYSWDPKQSSKPTPLLRPETGTSFYAGRTADGSPSDLPNVLTMTDQEVKRSGGFQRILPSQHSWKLYGPLLDQTTDWSYRLHKHCYPYSMEDADRCEPGQSDDEGCLRVLQHLQSISKQCENASREERKRIWSESSYYSILQRLPRYMDTTPCHSTTPQHPLNTGFVLFKQQFSHAGPLLLTTSSVPSVASLVRYMRQTVIHVHGDVCLRHRPSDNAGHGNEHRIERARGYVKCPRIPPRERQMLTTGGADSSKAHFNSAAQLPARGGRGDLLSAQCLAMHGYDNTALLAVLNAGCLPSQTGDLGLVSSSIQNQEGKSSGSSNDATELPALDIRRPHLQSQASLKDSWYRDVRDLVLGHGEVSLLGELQGRRVLSTFLKRVHQRIQETPHSRRNRPRLAQAVESLHLFLKQASLHFEPPTGVRYPSMDLSLQMRLKCSTGQLLLLIKRFDREIERLSVPDELEDRERLAGQDMDHKFAVGFEEFLNRATEVDLRKVLMMFMVDNPDGFHSFLAPLDLVYSMKPTAASHQPDRVPMWKPSQLRRALSPIHWPAAHHCIDFGGATEHKKHPKRLRRGQHVRFNLDSKPPTVEAPRLHRPNLP